MEGQRRHALRKPFGNEDGHERNDRLAPAPPLARTARNDRSRAERRRDRDPAGDRLARARSRQARALAIHRVRGRRARAGRAHRARTQLADDPALDEAAQAIERTRFSHAPLVVAVVSRAAPHVKIPEWEQVLSAGAACMNLVIAAHALGYAAGWLASGAPTIGASARRSASPSASASPASSISAGRNSSGRIAAPRAFRGSLPVSGLMGQLRLKESFLFYETRQRDKSLFAARSLQGHRRATRPIGSISTRSRDGTDQSGACSFTSTPLRPRRRSSASRARGSDSAAFARDSGEFVVNLASYGSAAGRLARPRPLCRAGRANSPIAGLTMAPCRLVDSAPRRRKPRRDGVQGRRGRRAEEPSGRGDRQLPRSRRGRRVPYRRRVHPRGVFDTVAVRSLARCGYQDYAMVDALIALARPPGGGGSGAA